MPIKRLDKGLGLTVLFGMAVMGMSPSAHSQTPPQTGEPRQHIRPTLNIMATATTNSEMAKGITAIGKKEMMLSVTPGIGFQIKGAQSELVGQFQLQGLRYVRGTQPDRVLPSGDVRLKLEAVKDAIGFDASLTATQVRADTTAQQATASNTANSYTDTTVHLAPYMRSRLDTNTHAEIRLDRGLLASSQNTFPGVPGNIGERDAYTSDDLIRVLRQPTPLGYEVQLLHKRDRYKNAPDPALKQREGSVSLLMAPNPDLTFGLKLLHAKDDVAGVAFSDTALGYQTHWRPTPRSVFQAQMEDRSYGRTWLVDLKHRWRRVSAGIRAERVATSYAREAGRPAFRAPSLTPDTPLPSSTSVDVGLQVPPQPFDTGAQLNQNMQGRLIVMGRRNQLSLVAGLMKTAPLQVAAHGTLTIGDRISRERYFEAELTHRLTPQHTLIGGLRWGRVIVTQASTSELAPSRDFVARAAVDTRLTPNTTATMGLTRQITRSSTNTSANETTGYVGLGHSF